MNTQNIFILTEQAKINTNTVIKMDMKSVSIINSEFFNQTHFMVLSIKMFIWRHKVSVKQVTTECYNVYRKE